MSQGRHRLGPPKKNRTRRIAAVAAPLATLAVVGVGVAQSDLGGHVNLSNAHAESDIARAAGPALSGSAVTGAVRSASISRSAERLVPVKATGTKWATTELNLYLAPFENAQVTSTFPADKKIAVTDHHFGRFTEVVVDKRAHWVHTEYLSDKKPVTDPASLGLASAPCAGTSSVMSGLVPDADRVYEAVCNNFPMIAQYGGYDAHGEHSSGKAIDIMTSDPSVGYRIADFLKAHASELNLYDIIYRQHIWTPERASEGWRLMPDRGSDTANHFDHVHVSVN